MTKANQTERDGIHTAGKIFTANSFIFREQSIIDLGIDAHAELVSDERGTGQLFGLQIKAGQSYLSEQSGEAYVFRTDKEHVDYWINHALPVLICLCDIDQEIVYWQFVGTETCLSTGKGHKILVPKQQQINQEALRTLGDLLTPLISVEEYTVFRTEDNSHNQAKRYSFDIVLNQ
ncbi:MAG: DUF4365 domain-containing protein, partial [Deinococcota bacterium]